jgi:hypothetical protein
VLDQSFREAARGTISYSSDRAASCQFRFTGSKITYYFTRAYNRGQASVEIDGVPKGTIDLYSAQAGWQAHATYDHLGEGPHTIVIRHAGAVGTFIDIDQLVVE